jgi:tRNA A-37 threonylcarbamoyl transferase component Bud32
VSPDLQEQLQAALGNAYLLERELGGGGMSRVFLAHERALNRKVVVKVLLPELAAGVNVERFRREIQLAAQLQHPHIVPLLAAGEAEQLPYFVMPFVNGESLRKRLAREGELPIGETVRILRDVVSALAYAHGCGVVHRDVKPDNVLLSGGVAVVTDFGVAKAVSASTDAGATGLTSLGVALGTPAYMAPEQATANPQTDHRADIYALGVVAYELLTGSQPFTGRSPQAVLAAHVVEDPEPVERRRPAVPPMLAALVRECLSKRPAERPQSAMQVMHVLDAVGTPSGGTAPTTAIRVPAVPSRLRKWPLPAAFAVLALLIAGGAFWLLRIGPAGSAPQSMVAPDHTHALLTPAESANMRPPRLRPETAHTDPPAARQTHATEATPPSRATRSDRAAARKPNRQTRPTAAPQPVFAEPAAETAQVADSRPAASAEAAPPPLAPVPAVPETTRPSVPAPPAPAPVPQQPLDPTPEIQQVIADYAAAIEAKSVAGLQRVYPSMTPLQERGWNQFFQVVRDMKAHLSLGRLDRSNGTADGQVSGNYEYRNTSTGASESRPVSFHAFFRRIGGQWRISQVR